MPPTRMATAAPRIVVTSPWGIGLLGLRGGAITSLTLSPNGTRLGEWLLNTGDNWIPAVGDLNGDGRAELVITSPWGLGILRFDGTSFVSIAMAPNGTVFGSWTLNTASDRVEAVADLDGDGRAELVIWGPQGLVVLGLSGASPRAEGLRGGWRTCRRLDDRRGAQCVRRDGQRRWRRQARAHRHE